MAKQFSRRRFIKGAGLLVASGLFSGCGLAPPVIEEEKIPSEKDYSDYPTVLFLYKKLTQEGEVRMCPSYDAQTGDKLSEDVCESPEQAILRYYGLDLEASEALNAWGYGEGDVGYPRVYTPVEILEEVINTADGQNSRKFTLNVERANSQEVTSYSIQRVNGKVVITELAEDE